MHNLKETAKTLGSQCWYDCRSFDYSLLWQKDAREKSFIIAILPVIITIGVSK
jgi:hypothetical protein